jgi:outer membrane protein assembly factor BamB
MREQEVSRNLIALTLAFLICAGLFSYMIYSNSDKTVKLGPVRIVEEATDSQSMVDQSQSRATAATLLWQFNTTEAEPISTPALADLDGNGYMEVIFASSGDAVYALNNTGGEYWSQPYTDEIIDGKGGALSYQPPPFFSSICVADIDMGSNPEIIFGVKDGVVCLQSNGNLHWLKGTTTGLYCSTPAVTDLEGNWTGQKDELEVIMGSEDTSYNGWLEAYHVDGGQIFRNEVVCGGEGAILTHSIVCRDLDGSFDDGKVPGPTEETDTEIVVGTHDRGVRVWGRTGTQPGGDPLYSELVSPVLGTHHTYGTAAVGNFTGNGTCEIISPGITGFSVTYTGWGGNLLWVDPWGTNLGGFATGASSASIMSSPAVADVHCSESDPDYEIYFGCDNGKFYCLDADSKAELWSYDTGGRVMSSPAICNIDSDDELEVIVGSDNGYVYCFDADPSDGDDDGQSIPGDSSASDIIWRYDTGSTFGISSPVVADINNDGQLEVVIGDTAGKVYCISAGGSCIPGQSDWPQFHRDTNNSGFYEQKAALPHITTPDVTSTLEDELYSVDYNASTADATGTFNWYLTTNASFLGINSNSGVLSGTPVNADVGTFWVNVSFSNGTFSVYHLFDLEVINVNDDPTIDTPDKKTAVEDLLYYNEYQGSDIDPTNDILSWSMTTNATFLSMLGNNLSGTPANEHVGVYWVLINLSDNKGGYAQSNFTLTVNNANDPPSILGNDLKEVYEDAEYVNDYDVIDADIGDDVFTWSLESDCGFLGIDNEGNLTGSPTNDDVGAWWVNVSVVDGFSGMDFRNFTLTVFNVNDWPYWVNVPEDVTIGIIDTYSFDVNASDIDKDDNILYDISSTEITSMGIDKDTGMLSWVPDRLGTFVFNISATDTYETIYHDFTIEVVSVNSPPVVVLKSPENGTEVDVLNPTLEWEVVDLDEDYVTCDIYISSTSSNVESLAEGSRVAQALDATSLDLEEPLQQGETYYWTVIPSDAEGFGSCRSGIWSFSVKETATEKNTPPEFTTEPGLTANPGKEWTYTPTATDEDGDEVTIALESGPDGMTFEGGVLSWTPNNDQYGLHTVNLSVTDGKDTTYQEFKLNSIGVLDDDIEPDDDDDDDTGTSLWALWIIIPIIILVLIALVIVGILMMRKKKEEEEEPSEEDSAAIEAEVESDDIFKQKEGQAFAATQAQQAQPMEPGMYPEEQFPQVEQPEGAAGMPEVEAAPAVDTPVPDQLPAWGEGAPEQGPDVTLPEEGDVPAEEASPDMDSPYAGEVDTGEDHSIKQLPQAEDDGI